MPDGRRNLSECNGAERVWFSAMDVVEGVMCIDVRSGWMVCLAWRSGGFESLQTLVERWRMKPEGFALLNRSVIHIAIAFPCFARMSVRGGVLRSCRFRFHVLRTVERIDASH